MTPERGRRGDAAMSHAVAAIREGDTIRSRLAPVGARESVGGLLARNAARYAAHAVYAERRNDAFRAVTWERFAKDVTSFGAFLDAAGVTPGARVAVVSPNRGEMLVAEFATMALGAIYVPIFAGYPADQVQGLLGEVDPAVVIVAGRDQLAGVRATAATSVVVTFDAIEPAAVERLTDATGVRHVTYGHALAARAADPARVAAFLAAAQRVDPDMPALLNFTSGTSGVLKGVVLTHDNILSQQRALSAIWSVTPEDRFLSYLPWHHSFGGIFEKYTALYNGATIHVDDSRGKDFEALKRNWAAVRPTIYFSVPHVYQQLVTHVQARPQDESTIFHDGLRFVFTAAAPLPGTVSAFFETKRVPVLEGWGLTETSPCCTLTDLNEVRSVPGMVGYPIPGVTIRIAPDGEILVRGANVMRGYYENPEATAQALPGDGWFHTGDLGEFVGAGLKLVARKDRVFKMLNAEKVVPTEIENRLVAMNSFIRHVIVAGQGRRFLSALIFPDYLRITEQFGTDLATADRVVKASLRETLVAFNAAHRVKYERIQAFAVISRELSLEAQELTPSMKVRVRNVLVNSGEYLEAVYEPSEVSDCRHLRKVMRLAPDDRRCFAGRDRTIDQCHSCGAFVFDDDPASDVRIQPGA
ncbi:MAG: AMP-binding protein [Gemmatimonadetes bacterium]|nr:AMP-binding protein [Gemmatimonadota bacterium]